MKLLQKIEREHNSKNKKFIIDVSLSLLASALPTAVLQLFVYSNVARLMGSEQYGLMITIYSIWILISNSTGNVLNNIRLLNNEQYTKQQIEGDFLILLRKFSVIISIISFVVIWFYFDNFSFIHIFLCIIIALLIYIKAYLEVGFRLIINYKLIAINGTLLSAGFMIGYYVFLYTNYWEFIFLCGYGLSCLFCILKTNLLQEKKVKTTNFEKTQKQFYFLLLATIISSSTVYADKLILYPLIGGTAVSIYYTATILGKITSMITGPLNNVILSYISKWGDDKKKTLTGYLLWGVIIVVVGYFFTLIIGEPLINILFPQWKNEVNYYLPVTTVTVMLTVIITMISPFTLKYCDIKWQIIFGSTGAIVYFCSSLLLWSFFGLMGFCVGTIIGESAKLAIMLVVYYSKKKKIASSI